MWSNTLSFSLPVLTTQYLISFPAPEQKRLPLYEAAFCNPLAVILLLHIEAVMVHHLRPHCRKVIDEFLSGAIAGVNFGKRAQL